MYFPEIPFGVGEKSGQGNSAKNHASSRSQVFIHVAGTNYAINEPGLPSARSSFHGTWSTQLS